MKSLKALLFFGTFIFLEKSQIFAQKPCAYCGQNHPQDVLCLQEWEQFCDAFINFHSLKNYPNLVDATSPFSKWVLSIISPSHYPEVFFKKIDEPSYDENANQLVILRGILKKFFKQREAFKNQFRNYIYVAGLVIILVNNKEMELTKDLLKNIDLDSLEDEKTKVIASILALIQELRDSSYTSEEEIFSLDKFKKLLELICAHSNNSLSVSEFLEKPNLNLEEKLRHKHVENLTICAKEIIEYKCKDKNWVSFVGAMPFILRNNFPVYDFYEFTYAEKFPFLLEFMECLLKNNRPIRFINVDEEGKVIKSTESPISKNQEISIFDRQEESELGGSVHTISSTNPTPYTLNVGNIPVCKMKYEDTEKIFWIVPVRVNKEHKIEIADTLENTKPVPVILDEMGHVFGILKEKDPSSGKYFYVFDFITGEILRAFVTQDKGCSIFKGVDDLSGKVPLFHNDLCCFEEDGNVKIDLEIFLLNMDNLQDRKHLKLLKITSNLQQKTIASWLEKLVLVFYKNLIGPCVRKYFLQDIPEENREDFIDLVCLLEKNYEDIDFRTDVLRAFISNKIQAMFLLLLNTNTDRTKSALKNFPQQDQILRIFHYPESVICLAEILSKGKKNFIDLEKFLRNCEICIKFEETQKLILKIFELFESQDVLEDLISDFLKIFSNVDLDHISGKEMASILFFINDVTVKDLEFLNKGDFNTWLISKVAEYKDYEENGWIYLKPKENCVQDCGTWIMLIKKLAALPEPLIQIILDCFRIERNKISFNLRLRQSLVVLNCIFSLVEEDFPQLKYGKVSQNFINGKTDDPNYKTGAKGPSKRKKEYSDEDSLEDDNSTLKRIKKSRRVRHHSSSSDED